jgi:hypothetical protein
VFDVESWMYVHFLSLKSVSAGAGSTECSKAEISEAEDIVMRIY